MADIFMSQNIKKLIKGKVILIMGDSNLRALYRDVIWLLNSNSIIPASHLRRKLDLSYLGDRLLKQGELNRGRDYVEMREYTKDDFNIKYNFLTKCYTEEVEMLMHDYKSNKSKSPDVILVNSCLWDITRWGPDGVNLYKENMRKLLSLFKSNLPSSTLVIFSTTLPVGKSCRGAFLVRQVEFMKHSLRFEVMEANLFARQLVPAYGYNLLDFHYNFRMQIHRREKDGVHWVPQAVRHMTNLLMTHISMSWGIPLPGNFKGKLLARVIASVNSIKKTNENVELPKLSILKDPVMPPPSKPAKKRKRRGNKNNNIPSRMSTILNPSFPNKLFNMPSSINSYGIERVIDNVTPNQQTFIFFEPGVHYSSTAFYEDDFFFNHRQGHDINQKFRNSHRYTSRNLPY